MLSDFLSYHELGQALTAAQQRTRDKALSVVHEGGAVRIVRAGWKRGAVHLAPVAGPLRVPEAVAYLERMGVT